QQLQRERLPPDAIALDLCTGSGVLAVAAARHGCRQVIAVDVSRKAVLAARCNARLNGVRVRSVRGDLFAPVRGRRFDLIVSNPPYVPSPAGELPRRGLARAWEAGTDGRVFLDRICSEASAHLRPGGVMLLVHSSVCGEQATVSALIDQGLTVDVALRHRGGLGPILRARAEWLRSRQLLLDDGQEEMLVIRAAAPGGEARQIDPARVAA
ncbi:MAG: release factor glutamine methyltransferase, partial [Solirubrobacteraceae bacterium]|nr:release factor glutamine methyltransferase [Solirubrobacteraceae bacterium]